MNKRHARVLALAIVSLLVAVSGCGPQRPIGTDTRTGDLITGRYKQTATLLQDGRVLVAGGRSDEGYQVRDSAESYDPQTGTFSATGTIEVPRVTQTATLLLDGRVLIAGGPDASAELYDPRTGSFSPTGSMSTPRGGHTATLLGDGRVLIAGGYGSGYGGTSALASAEIYDPKSGTFTATGSMTTPRGSHTATLLADGRVLIAGGEISQDGGALSSSEIYDPKSGTFGATNSMHETRHDAGSVLLKDGRVLVAGGAVDFSGELYDPRSATFAITAGPTWAGALAAQPGLLPDGRVLVLTDPEDDFLIYDTSSGSFSDAVFFTNHPDGTATVLHDGRVLIAGGMGPEGNEAFVYTP